MSSTESQPFPEVQGVRLVSSARFVADVLPIPAGVGRKELTGYVEGEVEHLSMLPLEDLAWGYLQDRKGPGGPILAYAALQDQVRSADDMSCFAVLPHFCCLGGGTWRQPTWVVLQETDCVTVVRFPAKRNVPNYVRSCFTPAKGVLSEDVIWQVRDRMLEEAPRENDDQEIEGVVRCAGMRIKGKDQIVFSLERQIERNSRWQHWKSARLEPESVLLSADIRDDVFLQGERQRRHNRRQLTTLLRVAAVLIVLLGIWQVRHYMARRAHESLVRKIEDRRAAVASLQEKESMSRSAAGVNAPAMEAFNWLMAMNIVRPETVSFASATFARSGRIAISGEAPSVAVVTQYAQALRDTKHYAELDIRDMQSTQRGVTFMLVARVVPGGPPVIPPAPPKEATQP